MMQHQNIDCARTQSSHLKTFPCPPLLSCQFLVTFQIMQPVTECPISCRDLDMFLIQDKSQLSPGQRSVTSCVIFSWETPWQMWWDPPTHQLAPRLCQGPYGPHSNNESQQTITSIMQEKFHFLLVFHLKNFTPYISHTTTIAPLFSKEQYAEVNRSNIANILNSTKLTIIWVWTFWSLLFFMSSECSHQASSQSDS